MRYGIGRERMYNERYSEQRGMDNVVWCDSLDIRNHNKFEVEFVSGNFPVDHGVRLEIEVGRGYLEIEGVIEKGKLLWLSQNDRYNKVIVTCYSKEGIMSVCSFHNRGIGDNKVSLLMDFAGMLVEENDNVFTYRCNHKDLDGDFTDLVFRITLL